MYWRSLNLIARRPATSLVRSWVVRRYYSSPNENQSTVAKTSKPLRILFCGSDDFSSSSLRALHDEQRRNPDLIASVDVLCRPGKPSGRGLRKIREVPIKAVAQELGLPIHERDTFTGWDLPNPHGESINLIVAVSFGLFVPLRILKSAEYGGLNVHPSILPNFRGPSPLQYTIMTNAQQCGVTLQSLDEKSFDNGLILAQTPARGLAIPLANKCTYNDLLNYLTPIAATMLVQGLKDKVFVPPLIDVGWLKHIKSCTETEKAKLTKIIHAPKITSADRKIDWSHSGVTAERKYRALGRLWTEIMFDTETRKRVVFEDIEVVPIPGPVMQLLRSEKGVRRGRLTLGEEKRRILRFMVTIRENGDLNPRFFVIDGDAIIIAISNGAVKVKQITIEGKGTKPARQVFEGLKEWDTWNILRENFHVIVKKNSSGAEAEVASESDNTAKEEADKTPKEGHAINE